MEEQGAEAVITSEDGEVKKERVEKDYRHQELDERLRKERTETEARLMKDSRKHGVPVPEIINTGDTKIKMEEINGDILKNNLQPKDFRELGENVAILHSIDIIHGDLTTSNVILGESVTMIDFGLAFRSQRLEDRAVDIYLLRQVLNSSHPETADKCWKSFLKGYNNYERCDEVLGRFKEVKERGRYK